MDFRVDPNRPVLQGGYLDIGGKIVATDGSRLFLWTAESLGSLSAPVLVGPWHDIHLLPADAGFLKDVVQALELKPAQQVRISFTAPEKVIQFAPVDDPGRKTLLMPMRMKGERSERDV